MGEPDPIWLSVDWEFFVREEPSWGFRRMDDEPCREGIWEDRLALAEEVRWDIRGDTDPAEFAIPRPADFWESLSGIGIDVRGAELAVADSHAFAAPFFLSRAPARRIVHFDAHHDMGCGSGDMVASRGSCSASNWLHATMAKEHGLRAEVVYPGWGRRHRGCGPVRASLARRVRESIWGDGVPPEPGRVSAVFIARSGASCPPWLDHCFGRLLSDGARQAGSRPLVVGCSDADPMETRRIGASRFPFSDRRDDVEDVRRAIGLGYDAGREEAWSRMEELFLAFRDEAPSGDLRVALP